MHGLTPSHARDFICKVLAAVTPYPSVTLPPPCALFKGYLILAPYELNPRFAGIYRLDGGGANCGDAGFFGVFNLSHGVLSFKVKKRKAKRKQ